MKHYEVTFIVDPVLSGDEIKETEQVYESMLKDAGYGITHVDEMGLKQLAYPINRRSSGIYYCIEFSGETGEIVNKLELALRRDERIMRFLTIALDKYGVKYNDDKRNGLIGKVQTKAKKDSKSSAKGSASAPTPAPVKKAAPIAAAPVVAPKGSSEEE